MDKRVLRERMRRKQQQLRRRRMMKRITCVVAAILLLVFVVRGVILPIVNHAGGGSNKDAETVNVQANTAGASTGSSTKDGTASTDTAASDTDSADSGTDATVMPVKGSAAGERLSVMTPGWHEDSTGKWYQNPDGTYYVNGFADIDGTTYSFDKKGYMQTGWVEKGVKDYYFNEEGSYDPSKKRPMIALTFDDGPGEYTETLLDTVEKYNIHVTFFMLGKNVEGRESTIQRMVKLGCEIGNHTWDHQELPNMDLDSALQEFQKTDDALVKACGQAPTVCRAPYGAITDEQISAVGKPFFMWSTDSLDWKLMDADADYNQIMNDSSLGDGSVILMHDIHEPSVKCATEKLIPALIDQGYKLVTVSELAEAKDVTLQSASYSDFWDSSLQAGRVAGYAGNSSDSEDSSEDGSDGSDSSDGSDVSDGSSDEGDYSDGSDESDYSDGSFDDGSYDDGSYDESYDDGSEEY
ncbi:polysaccharide deacetylase family protein [Blautia massiliensis (ex Durand et al. 2017)]|uniref:polysaccharide deacetylase family protein n=1 Tax=Blautia massiliensis (ex Durand et al. 2017) TaxID=1737424 RepID=UPI002432C046|nr:polysaccharide deacetylase family protein [Blautia massiliensis (ex Durand et al. 2017)]MDD6549178.1 polysaccharide deacetylase family protein [Blautia massiliensis (ex Durand et al. 2017)]